MKHTFLIHRSEQILSSPGCLVLSKFFLIHATSQETRVFISTCCLDHHRFISIDIFQEGEFWQLNHQLMCGQIQVTRFRLVEKSSLPALSSEPAGQGLGSLPLVQTPPISSTSSSSSFLAGSCPRRLCQPPQSAEFTLVARF